MIALIEAALVALVIIVLAFYVYIGFAVFAIAKKTKTPKAWLAFVPIANVFLMARIADVSAWYTTSLLLALIPYVGYLITLATLAYIWCNIAEKLRRPGWWGWLTLIPVVNLVIIGVLAWGREQTFAVRVKQDDFLIAEKK